jgi:hypothetical protein
MSRSVPSSTEETALTDEELDEFRRLLVAFEDTAVWCEQLAERARGLIEGVQQKRPPTQESLADHLRQIAETLRYVEDERRLVGTIRARIGLPLRGE